MREILRTIIFAVLYRRGWQTFSEEGQIVNILGSAGYVVSVATARLWPWSRKAAPALRDLMGVAVCQ